MSLLFRAIRYFVENTLLLHLYLFGELLGSWAGSENVACGSGMMKNLHKSCRSLNFDNLILWKRFEVLSNRW